MRAEIRTTQPQVSDSSCTEFQIITEQFNIFKLTGIDQIPAELIKSGARRVGLVVHNTINFLLIKQ
jgi:hypothetical protein